MRQRRTDTDIALGQSIEAQDLGVPGDEPAGLVEDRQPVIHAVERGDQQPRLVDQILVQALNLKGLVLEDVENPSQVADLVAPVRGRHPRVALAGSKALHGLSDSAQVQAEIAHHEAIREDRCQQDH